jgi:hypothetical protein
MQDYSGRRDLVATKNTKRILCVGAVLLVLFVMSTVDVYSSSNITVETSKPSYETGEKIEAFGNVTNDGQPVTGLLVGFNLTSPSNDTVLYRTNRTDASGAFELTFTLAQGMELGTYVIHVTCSVGEETVSSSTTFDLVEDPIGNSLGGGGGRMPCMD